MIDDFELLRSYVEESAEDAFRTLVQRHVDLVYAAARRRTGGDSHLAREATQQVFTALACKASALRRHTSLTGWLFISARYAAAQLVRAERRRRRIERKAQNMQDLLGEDESTAAIEWERLRPQLDDLIGGLGERDREIVLLRFYEGQAYGEIGHRLGLSEEGARSRLDRALEKLRRALARRGVTSSSSALALALSSQAGIAAPVALATALSGTALTSAGVMTGSGAATSVFAIINFMSTTKIIAGVAALITALGVGFGIRERLRANEATAEHATALSECMALQARVRELESHSSAAPSNVSAPVPETRMAAAAFVSAQSGGLPGAIPDEALDRFVAANPELQKLYLRQSTLRTASSYGPFYRTAGLTPAQIAAFEKVMTNHQQGVLDIAAAAIEQNLDKNSSQLQQLRDTVNEERNRALRDTLGPDGFAAFSDYQKMRAMRDVANYAAGELFYTSAPLTADQADALTRIVTLSRRDGKGVETWDLIVERAQEGNFLTSEQLAVLAVRRDQMKLGEEIYTALAPLRAAHQSGAASALPR